MRATDVNSLAASDMITVGITENANNEFTYGEDEYDLPNPMVDIQKKTFQGKSEYLNHFPQISSAQTIFSVCWPL